MNTINSTTRGLREMTAEQVQLVSGGKADFSGVTATVDTTAEKVSDSCVRSSSMMPYFSFACL
ncbi:hypothetical protein D9M71_803170 [compost metagenome]|uniref:hypothetical protein n=1 Tax=Stenotrophomonas sp. PS02300 TaxID=2991426 RepID=UPI00249B3B28|nr:hypothetical protein [Stenotrophomonas sp. PS02300]